MSVQHLSQIKTTKLVDGLNVIPEDEDVIAVRIHLTKVITIIDLKKVIEETNKDKELTTKHILLSKVMKLKLNSFDFKYPFM